MAQSKPHSVFAVERIVVGVDFTRASDEALRQAMQLAQMIASSELHVTHVIPSPNEVHDAAKLDALSSELQDKLVELRERTEYVCAPEQSHGVLSQDFAFHVRLGSPAEALHQVAIDIDADMLIVGTHARSGIEKLLLGSIAERLVRIAHLPVLIAHPKELSDLHRSSRPEPPRPGEDLHNGATHRARIELSPRSSHISGLI